MKFDYDLLHKIPLFHSRDCGVVRVYVCAQLEGIQVTTIPTHFTTIPIRFTTRILKGRASA